MRGMSAGIFASSTSSTTLCSRFSSHYTTTRTARTARTRHAPRVLPAPPPAPRPLCPPHWQVAGAPPTPATLHRCSCWRRLAARAVGDPLGRQKDRHRQRAIRARAAGRPQPRRRRRHDGAVSGAALAEAGGRAAQRRAGSGAPSTRRRSAPEARRTRAVDAPTERARGQAHCASRAGSLGSRFSAVCAVRRAWSALVGRSHDHRGSLCFWLGTKMLS